MGDLSVMANIMAASVWESSMCSNVLYSMHITGSSKIIRFPWVEGQFLLVIGSAHGSPMMMAYT
jgi:hypothetical protein